MARGVTPIGIAISVALTVALGVPRARAQTTDRMHASARYDVMVRWAPRYVLDTSVDPLGLEQQYWRRVDSLPMYHRTSFDASFPIDEQTLSLHFSGWGALDLFADSEGGIAAGDVAIGFVELAVAPAPVRLWAGRRFITFGPPGGLHVDGGGASVASDVGLHAEAFVGRPVTPMRTSVLGPVPSFVDPGVAFGARIGYRDPGVLAASAGYAERWGHGIAGTRTVDVASTWTPIPELSIEAATQIDVLHAGVATARVSTSARVMRELTLDADYLHVDPGRWIPAWSILSVFETSVFDELALGGTLRPLRRLAVRLELAGRAYSAPDAQSDEPRLGYRAELSGRVLPSPEGGPRLHARVSRRDDGTIGYTLATAAVAFDLLAWLVTTIDGAFAIDDGGGRESLLARLSADVIASREWSVGATVSVARTPIVEAETRAMLRASWSPRGIGR